MLVSTRASTSIESFSTWIALYTAPCTLRRMEARIATPSHSLMSSKQALDRLRAHHGFGFATRTAWASNPHERVVPAINSKLVHPPRRIARAFDGFVAERLSNASSISSRYSSARESLFPAEASPRPFCEGAESRRDRRSARVIRQDYPPRVGSPGGRKTPLLRRGRYRVDRGENESTLFMSGFELPSCTAAASGTLASSASELATMRPAAISSRGPSFERMTTSTSTPLASCDFIVSSHMPL